MLQKPVGRKSSICSAGRRKFSVTCRLNRIFTFYFFTLTLYTIRWRLAGVTTRMCKYFRQCFHLCLYFCLFVCYQDYEMYVMEWLDIIQRTIDYTLVIIRIFINIHELIEVMLRLWLIGEKWCLRRILRVPYTAHVTNVSVRSVTNRPTAGFLANTTTPPHAVWAHSSGCSLRGLTSATSIHWSPPCWLAPPKRPTSSVLASNSRQRSQTTQLGLNTALRRATDRPSWRRIVETAMLFERASRCRWRWWLIGLLAFTKAPRFGMRDERFFFTK